MMARKAMTDTMRFAKIAQTLNDKLSKKGFNFDINPCGWGFIITFPDTGADLLINEWSCGIESYGFPEDNGWPAEDLTIREAIKKVERLFAA